MIWIVSNDIMGNTTEKKARLQFIKDITKDEGASWKKLSLNGIIYHNIFDFNNEFYGDMSFHYCITNDNEKGVIITAHNNIVKGLCKLEHLFNNDYIVANTCIGCEQNFDKLIMKQILDYNPNGELYYAIQKNEYIARKQIIKTNSIDMLGTFGFMTSKSERKLYRNKDKGIKQAIQSAFYKVQIDKL